MTTVFYDGTVLAADSRTTHGRGPDHACHSCGETTFNHTDGTIKISIGKKGALFRGEQIVAVGCSGDSAFNRGVRSSIREGRDVEEDIKVFFGFAPPGYGSTFLIITDKQAWKVNVDTNQLKAKNHPLGTPLACGSGAKAAKAINRFTGCSAVESLAAAIEVDRYTGGAIHHIDTTVKDAKIITIEAEQVKEIKDNLNFKSVKKTVKK